MKDVYIFQQVLRDEASRRKVASEKVFRSRAKAKVPAAELTEAKVAGAKEIGARFGRQLLRMFGRRQNAQIADVPIPKGFLIDLLVPPDRAEDMLVGLQKAYEERWVPKYGARCARRMFIMHSVGVIIGFWINWIKKHLNVLRFFAS